MAQPDESERSHAIEQLIGKLLRTCVIITSAIVLAGAALYLPRAWHDTPSYHSFQSEPERFRSVPTIIAGAMAGRPRAIIEAGLLLLVLTPVLRVAFSAIAFLHERDYLYVGLTLVVLALLVGSLVAG